MFSGQGSNQTTTNVETVLGRSEVGISGRRAFCQAQLPPALSRKIHEATRQKPFTSGKGVRCVVNASGTTFSMPQ